MEFRAGTGGNDPTSGPFVTGFTSRPGGGFEMEFETVDGVPYQFEKSPTLENGAVWTPIGSIVIGDSSAAAFIAADEPIEPRMFYRLPIVEP